MLYFIVCELSKEKPSVKWEIETDEGDGDFLCHTLFLKQVIIDYYIDVNKTPGLKTRH